MIEGISRSGALGFVPEAPVPSHKTIKFPNLLALLIIDGFDTKKRRNHKKEVFMDLRVIGIIAAAFVLLMLILRAC